MQIIRNQYPPNYADILAAFPMARKAGVIFAYGGKIYAPTSNDISIHLMAHEAVHGERQRDIGVELWWRHYINNREFRYHEELLAHRAEYRSMIANNPNRGQRRAALKIVAQRLASPLYGCGGGYKKAERDILENYSEGA